MNGLNCALRRDYDAAWRAYLKGDYDLCLQIAGALNDERARFLEARVLLRTGKPEEAVSGLRFDAQDECQRLRLMGTALGRCGMFELATSELRRARELAKTAKERSQIDFYTALQEWMLGNFTAAEEALPRHGIDADLAISIADLQGWIAVGTRDFKSALQHFMRALEAEVDRGDNADRYMLVRQAHAALAIAREFSHAPVAGEIEAALEGIRWTRTMDVSRFHVRRYLAWTVAIEGNYSKTFLLLRQARDSSPSPAWRVSILCEMAYLALSVGERRWSDNLATEALDLVEDIDWAATAHEERKGLLLLAQITSNRDAEAARLLLEKYDALPAPPPMISHDIRDVALEEFVHGCVAHASGDAAAAAAHYARAFDIYHAIGFQWRAILCALARGEVTHRREHYEYAAMQMRMFPNSWLRDRVSDTIAMYENPVGIRFTPTQLEVLNGLFQGKTDREIAQDMQRSTTTVRDHLKEIRKITHTKNRSELIAYCARNGLLAALRR